MRLPYESKSAKYARNGRLRQSINQNRAAANGSRYRGKRDWKKQNRPE